MKTLKEYLEIEDKVERLSEFFNDNGNWQNKYIDDCPDYRNNYYELIEDDSNIYYGDLEDDTRILLEDYIEDNGIGFLFDEDLIECDIHYGIRRKHNELWSFNLGEIEVQYTGLFDDDSRCNCIYTELIKGMSESDIEDAKNCEYYVSDNGCIYIDRSYDRVSFTLKEDEFLKLTEKYKVK